MELTPQPLVELHSFYSGISFDMRGNIGSVYAANCTLLSVFVSGIFFLDMRTFGSDSIRGQLLLIDRTSSAELHSFVSFDSGIWNLGTLL